MFARFFLFPFPFFVLSRAFTFTVTIGIDENNGKQGLGFDPSSINPVAGDTIAFTFQLPDYIKNPNMTQHSVTQSTFDSPCTPKPDGFNTGVQSTGSISTNTGSTFNLLVNDTQPLWFFSSENSDCNSGMVLAVNPPTSGDQTAVAFKEKAKQASATPSSSSVVPSGTSTASPSMTVVSTNAAIPRFWENSRLLIVVLEMVVIKLCRTAMMQSRSRRTMWS